MRAQPLAAAVVTVLAACSDEASLPVSPDPASPQMALSRAVVGPLDDRSGYDIQTWGYFPNDSAEFTDPQWRDIWDAARRWEAILAPSDPWTVHAGMLYCPGVAGTTVRVNAEVDDIIILFRLVRIDGPDGVLAQAAPCVTRTRGLLPPFGPATLDFLPAYGVVMIDEADIDALERDQQLGDVFLHEIGHALGFASQAWDILGFVEDARPPGSAIYHDTYFDGPRAVEAFEDIADGYGGTVVPVDNRGFQFTAHWRESVMGNELMSPSIGGGGALSLITANALVDIGYTIDPREVDRYELPAEGDRAADRSGGRSYGHDVPDWPVMMIDRDGKIIPPR